MPNLVYSSGFGIKPWRREHWCLPKKIDVAFVGAMEDVLSVYERPYDEAYPQVNLDEKLVTLHADVTEALPVQPGQAERVDYEYERLGTANVFVMVERLAGYRHVELTDRRTAVDYARQLQWLADIRYPNAKKIRLVQDNLNTHRLANLYLVFPPAEAFRRAQRFELHYMPKHGSWLNMAEIEIGVFERACLQRYPVSMPFDSASRLSKLSVIPPTPPLTGVSPPPTPALNSLAFILNWRPTTVLLSKPYLI